MSGLVFRIFATPFTKAGPTINSEVLHEIGRWNEDNKTCSDKSGVKYDTFVLLRFWIRVPQCKEQQKNQLQSGVESFLLANTSTMEALI